MATRSRSSPIDRKSWKSSAPPASPTLVYYRRLIFSLLLFALVGAFVWLCWFYSLGAQPWTFMAVTVSEYDRLHLPNLAFAERDQQAVQSLGEKPTSLAPEEKKRLSDLLEELRSAAADGKEQVRSAPLLVWISAHGISQGESPSEQAFLLESDYRPGERSSTRLKGRVALQELLRAIHDYPADTKVLVLDSGPLERDVQLGMADRKSVV